MIQGRHITILSGGGSPHTDEYGPVYRPIEEEGERRGWSTHLIDYVGVGHAPEFGMGLNLPSAVAKARRDIKARPAPAGSTLLCRSFGCDVGAYLFAHHSHEMTAFKRVILWGPSGMNTYWDLVGKSFDAIEKLNAEIQNAKGCKIGEDFWSSFSPIEDSVREFRSTTVEIAYVTKDKYCDAPFAEYLAALSPEEHERIKREYFRLIFGHYPEPEIMKPEL